MTTHWLEARQCSQCQAVLFAVTREHGDEQPPEPGDLLVCSHCGARLVYDVARQLRSLSPREFAALEPGVRRTLNTVREAVQGGKMDKKNWLALVPLLACSSGAGGTMLEDAGEMLIDAGEALVDAGGDAAEAQVPTEIGCDVEVVQTRVTSTAEAVTTWSYAEATVPADAELDAWLCDFERYDPPPYQCPPDSCVGEVPPDPLDCVQANLEREGEKVRVLCGIVSVTTYTDGTPESRSGQVRRTLRLRIR